MIIVLFKDGKIALQEGRISERKLRNAR